MAAVSIDLDDLTCLLDHLRRASHADAQNLLNTALTKGGRPTVTNQSPGVMPTNYDPDVDWTQQVLARAKTAINAAA